MQREKLLSSGARADVAAELHLEVCMAPSYNRTCLAAIYCTVFRAFAFVFYCYFILLPAIIYKQCLVFLSMPYF